MTKLLYLARTSQDLGEVQAYLTAAGQELRRLSIIISQTLRFHRQAYAASTVSCADLFSTILPIYEGRLLNSNIVVEQRNMRTSLSSALRVRFRQVLNNLVGNAIDQCIPAAVV